MIFQLSQLQNIIQKTKTDAFFVSNATNILYLLDFSASFARMICTPKKIILISDARYTPKAREICKKYKDKKDIINRIDIEYKEISSDKNFWNTLFQENNIKNIVIEAHEMTVSEYEKLKTKWNITIKTTEKAEGVLGNSVEKIRSIKTEEEITYLQNAACIGDVCLAKVVENFKEGITEKELAWIFEKTAREHFGTSGLSFDTIVAFGENSASPHHIASDKKLEKNTPILIDCGVRHNNYCSDLTRCFWFGEKNTPEYAEWKKVYDIVKKAQELGIEKMQENIKISNSETVARKFFQEQGYDDTKYFGHSFGHGVGIDIHELPHVSSRNTEEKYQKNMVITAEPGLYFSDNSKIINFGIRIEDLLYISPNTGKAEYLSSFKK